MTARELELEQLLKVYQRRYPGEQQAVARMLDLLQNTPPGSAMNREHYAPGHFTASAFVLSPEQNQVLLIHHGKLLRWLQPGGHIEDSDQSVIDAAHRELTEEAQVRSRVLLDGALFDVDIHSIPARDSASEHEHFDLRFLFAAADRFVCASSDALEARWFGLNDLSGLRSDDSVRKALTKLPPSPARRD